MKNHIKYIYKEDNADSREINFIIHSVFNLQHWISVVCNDITMVLWGITFKILILLDKLKKCFVSLNKLQEKIVFCLLILCIRNFSDYIVFECQVKCGFNYSNAYWSVLFHKTKNNKNKFFNELHTLTKHKIKWK